MAKVMATKLYISIYHVQTDQTSTLVFNEYNHRMNILTLFVPGGA